VTKNLGERVSVSLGTVAHRDAPKGVPFELPVRIVNQGYAMGRLEARPVSGPHPDAMLAFPFYGLKGVPAETRMLRITLTSHAPTDPTIAFQLSSGAPDLGCRDRIHPLLLPSPDAGASAP
jgi:hypothetical protein